MLNVVLSVTFCICLRVNKKLDILGHNESSDQFNSYTNY